MSTVLRVSAVAKVVIFVVFAVLLFCVFWPSAICWQDDPGHVHKHVIPNYRTDENFIIEASLNRSGSAYRIPLQVCLQTNVSSMLCPSTKLAQDDLCFGFGKFFLIWIVQCINGLLLSLVCAGILWKRSNENGAVTQTDLAIPAVVLAFSLTIFWLHRTLESTWNYRWWGGGWMVPSMPYDGSLVCKLCAVAVLSAAFDFVVLSRAFRNKLMMADKRC
uniref:Claudin domain-containing protein n=1 Tax=Steinernema glaseri TaxID=37863 RepID=A0A1I7YX24_9BILA